jgi:hypothetical protein
MRTAAGWGVSALLTFSIALSSAGDAPAQEDAGVAAAEALVRQHYFEGIPYEPARALTPAGVARLAEMLENPEDGPYRANIVMALGLSGQARAYEALAAYAARASEGQLEGPESRARLVIPLAMGHLAQSDDRALAYLVQAARAPGRAPRWAHRHLRGPRLGALLRRGAITGLAISGRAEAGGLLRALERQAEAPEGGPQGARSSAARRKLRHHVDRAKTLHSRVASEGPRGVFGGASRR